MNLRDGLKKLADETPSEIVPTKFGDVKVVAPLASRVDVFRTALGGEKKELPITVALLVALACHDPATGSPCFQPSDVAWLETVPVAAFGRLTEAVERVAESLSLDPTTPATGTGSD